MLSKITPVPGNIFATLKNSVVLLSDVPIIAFVVFFVNLMIWGIFPGWSFSWVSLISNPWVILGHLFTHKGFDHLFGNMLFFVFLAPTLEKYLGHLKFLVVYLGSGILGSIGFLYIYPQVSILGASGAISGLLAIYPFVCRKTLTFLMVGVIILTYFVLNFQNTLFNSDSPTAYLAHVGGGVAGLIFLNYFNRKV